jgi:3',5'-cyclic-AMP phosphodiesterase
LNRHRTYFHLFLAVIAMTAFGSCTLTNHTPTASGPTQNNSESVSANLPTAAAVESFRFAVVTDTHADTKVFPLLLEEIKADNVDFVIHLGDITRVGALSEFRRAKQILDASGLSYYTVPGDHDLVGSHDTSYYEQVFGQPYSSFTWKGIRFILLNNSDGESGMSASELDFINAESEPTLPKLVFLHVPPSHPWFVAHTMQETQIGQAQAQILLQWMEAEQVEHVFAGEMHSFVEYTLPGQIPLTVAGVSGEVENSDRPSYILVRVMQDLTVTTEHAVMPE